MTHTPIKSLPIANRSEISIRVMRAAAEMNIRTVAIDSGEDRSTCIQATVSLRRTS